MYSIPWNVQWANQTLNVLTQSLENFGFMALYHSTGPPYPIELNLLEELTAIWDRVLDGKSFTTDLDFQEAVQKIIQKTMDAHTRYNKPVVRFLYLIVLFSYGVVLS